MAPLPTAIEAREEQTPPDGARIGWKPITGLAMRTRRVLPDAKLAGNR
ncbi:MAG: hypothetical protein ACRD3N_13400 [Terracidiphilus sp.]